MQMLGMHRLSVSQSCLSEQLNSELGGLSGKVSTLSTKKLAGNSENSCQKATKDSELFENLSINLF